LGYPGTLPVPNETAVAWTQLLGAALNCKLARQSKFDRKSYFYPDLPKGYQISQYDQPFCGEGELSFSFNGTPTKVGITRIHLEEDAAKNTHPANTDYTLIDFNRAGTPLAEIVTKPEISSPAVAKAFLQELQRLARLLDISDADMAKGQLRCDANISLRPVGDKEMYPKTEIKNINSFRFVARALQYEIERQTKEWQQAGKLPDSLSQQTTRGFDSKSGKTTEHRSKEEAADYRYFPEPDIPPFVFTAAQLNQHTKSLPELPSAKENRLKDQCGISNQQASLLANNSILSNFFENTVSEIEQLDNEQTDIAPQDRKELTQTAINIILRDLRTMVTEHDLTASDIKITPANFAEMIVLVYQGKINQSAITPILAEMQRTGGDPDHIIQNLNLAQVSDTDQLTTYVDQVIAANPDIVAKIKAGKESALQYLMGQVMQKTQGKANPQEVIKLLQKKISS